jgi:hypothetical protein
MVGAILVVLVVVVVLPVGMLVGGAVVSAALGTALDKDAARRHEGSELVDLNV